MKSLDHSSVLLQISLTSHITIVMQGMWMKYAFHRRVFSCCSHINHYINAACIESPLTIYVCINMDIMYLSSYSICFLQLRSIYTLSHMNVTLYDYPVKNLVA